MQALQIAVFVTVSAISCGANRPASEAPAQLRVPLLGYIQSGSGELSPITGFVGAQVVNGAVSYNEGVVRVFPAPGQEFAFVEAGDPARIGIALLNEAGTGKWSALPGVLTEVERADFSPSGQSAILYSSRLQHLQIVTGLPDAPRIAGDIDTSSFSAPCTAAAVSDDAEVALAAFSGDGAAVVARLDASAPPRVLLNRKSASSIRFFRKTHLALVADPQANEILLVGEDETSPGNVFSRLLAGESDGVSVPLDVQTSPGGGLVFVANSGSSNVLVIDRTKGQTRALPCGFTPQRFQPLMKSVIGVIAQDGESVAVLDAGAVTPWLAFAPRVHSQRD